MLTVEKCPFCEGWQTFEKEGKKDSPHLPWICPACGEQVMKFPERKRILGGRIDNVWT